MECSVCGKKNACIERCDVKLCLLDFLCSMHAGHYGQSKIIDVDQFNKDLDYCKQVEVDLKSDLQMKAECEISLGNDIRTIDKSSQREKEASSRVVSESSKAWDLEQKKKAVSDSVIDMSLYFPHESVIESLPPIPRIERNENDSFAAIMTKMLTRSLQYRFDFMPLKMKQEVLDFYHADSSSDDSFLFARELGSIVMQMVSVILSKGERGELWISKPNTEGRTIEMTWSKEERMRQWVRSLDSNLLSCDDTAIIQLILLKVESEECNYEVEDHRHHRSRLQPILLRNAVNEIVISR